MRFKLILFGLILAPGADASAQVMKGEVMPMPKVCSTGPGAPLGIRGYSCASCGVQRLQKGSEPSYFFETEPVITEAIAGAPYRPGDAVIAINGKPITTREAAQDFAFPRVG